MLRCSSFIKVLLAIWAALLILSPKGVKALIGYEGVWFNPQLVFIFFTFPLLAMCRTFDFGKFKANDYLIKYIFLICTLYFLSTLISFVYTPVSVYYPLSESIRQTFNFLLVFIPILCLKHEYISFVMKFLIMLGLLELLFVVYGLLGAFGYIPTQQFLKDIVLEAIFNQSWTVIGFLPKWGGTFPETQELSTFILMCYVFTDIVFKSKKNGVRILKLLFIVSIIYLQSKSTIVGLVLYLLFSVNRTYRYSFLPVAVLGVVYFIYKATSQEFVTTFNLESLALQYSSFGERLFHIVKSMDYMKDNIIQFFFGLGPRTYGTIVSIEYPSYFNEYSNAISIFNVLSDLGIIGFIVFIFFLILLYKNIKSFKLKIAYISILVSYMLQVAWGESFVYMFLALLLNYDKSTKRDARIFK